MLVEALFAEPSVEALDERVLRRLSWLDEVELDATLVRPAIEGFADELRPVVGDDRLGQAVFLDGSIQNSSDANA